MSIEFHKIWIDQCEATEGIRDHFGLNNALDYLIGEKLFSFVHAAEQHPEFATELPAFVAAIRHLFTAEQIRDYLDRLEERKYLAPRGPDPEPDDVPEEDEDDSLDNPVIGAEELLRFLRVREVLLNAPPEQ